MGNKQSLQLNNEELQAALKTIRSLPTAKAWGGASIIEPSSEDILIPAFTNVDLTVKGVDLSKFGIKRGTVTASRIGTLQIDIGMNSYAAFILYGGSGAIHSGDNIFRIYTAANHQVWSAENYYSYLYNNWSSATRQTKNAPNGNILTIEGVRTVDGGSSYDSYFDGTYNWIAIA